MNSVYIETSFEESLRKEDFVMLTLSDFIAIISLVVTCFGLGYAIGRNSRTKK